MKIQIEFQSLTTNLFSKGKVKNISPSIKMGQCVIQLRGCLCYVRMLSKMLVQNNYLPKHREDVLRNGLKFENDRKFKNRLILKTILLMAVLVVAATCGFVAWSKLRSNDTDSPPVKVTTIIRKGGCSFIN